VCGMLRDKDIPGVLRAMAPRVTRWHVCSLPGPRAASAEQLAAALSAAGTDKSCIEMHASPAQAVSAAKSEARESDKIVVFGSFLTVGEAMAWLNNNKTSKR